MSPNIDDCRLCIFIKARTETFAFETVYLRIFPYSSMPILNTIDLTWCRYSSTLRLAVYILKVEEISRLPYTPFFARHPKLKLKNVFLFYDANSKHGPIL